MVDRSVISLADIGEESIVVTFGNGASGEYPLVSVRVKIDGKKYCMKGSHCARSCRGGSSRKRCATA